MILGVSVQLLTVLLPGLRKLLGLEPLTWEMLTLVSAAALLTWGMAEAYSRFALATHQAQAPQRIDRQADRPLKTRKR